VRQFFNPTRSPNLVSFHEPHSGDTLHKATLYDSLRKLQLSPDEFVQLLYNNHPQKDVGVMAGLEAIF
jgi:hypothetical protein